MPYLSGFVGIIGIIFRECRLEVEAAFRTLKSTLDLRPVYHRLEGRIRAHVLVCWLALLLIRIAERATGDTWEKMRSELQKLHLGEFGSENGRIWQRTELTNLQQGYLHKLGLQAPPRFLEILPGSGGNTS